MTELALQPALDLVTAPAVEQIADYLSSLLGPARPRRVARMFDPGGDKYRDIPRHEKLDRSKLLAHASGAETWAATLDHDGMSRAGVIEVDQGGRAAVLAVLTAAEKAGLTCYAIAVDNPLSGHSGGHVIFPYFLNVANADITAQLQQVASAAGLGDVEIWPRNHPIRLPFGYHRWAKTRGQLLTQAGEVVDLDTDLVTGMSLIVSIVSNEAPPTHCADWAPKKADPDRYLSSDKGDYTKLARVSPGEAAAGRASLADVKAKFNAEHTWPELLGAYGGKETRDGWACSCGWQHTHDTQIAITSQGKIVSFSPNCRWAPHKDSGRALDKFGFYVLVEHGDNVTAALKELNPITPRQRPPAAPQPAQVYRTAEMDADAEKRRAERRAAAAATLAEIQARASADTTLSDRAQLVLLALLETAGTRDWTRASVARLAELTEMCERYVHEGLRELEDRHYISSGRRNGSTTFRTFVRLQDYVKRADEYRSIACEGGASSPAESVYPPTLPDWQQAKVAELGAMDDAAFAAWFISHNFTPKKAIVLNTEAPEQNAAEPDFSDYSDITKGELVFADFADATKGVVAVLAEPQKETIQDSSTQKGAFVHNSTLKSGLDLTDLTPVAGSVADRLPTKTADSADNNDYTKTGATYTPIELPPNRTYTGRPRALMSYEMRAELVRESMRLLPDAGDDEQAEQLPLAASLNVANDYVLQAPKPSASDRYLVELAGMSESELAGELIKHQRTIAKHSGAAWLPSVRARLRLVEHEIDARELAGVAIAPRSQAHTPLRRAQGEQSPLWAA